MKSIFVLIYSLLIGGHDPINDTVNYPVKVNVSEKLLHSFNERFPDAEQISWQELPKTYIVNFVEYGVRSRIVYDKQGAFISSTRYYQERDLPYYLLNILRKRYTGKTIFAVTEQTTDTEVEYYVKLQDDKIWLTIRMDSNGNLDIVEKYRKAS